MDSKRKECESAACRFNSRSKLPALGVEGTIVTALMMFCAGSISQIISVGSGALLVIYIAFSLHLGTRSAPLEYDFIWVNMLTHQVAPDHCSCGVVDAHCGCKVQTTMAGLSMHVFGQLRHFWFTETLTLV